MSYWLNLFLILKPLTSLMFFMPSLVYESSAITDIKPRIHWKQSFATNATLLKHLMFLLFKYDTFFSMLPAKKKHSILHAILFSTTQ